MRTRAFWIVWIVILLGGLTRTGEAQETFQVAAVTPAPLTGNVNPAAPQIVVAFDRPIVPLVSNENRDDLPQPLSLDPKVRGTGQWLTTSLYVFYPTADTLRANTEYTATIQAGLTATDGSVLAEDYRWTFRTMAPQSIQILDSSRNGSRTYLDSNFSVSFTQPMATTTTEAAFQLWLQPDFLETDEVETGVPMLVPGTFSWNKQQTRLTFQPEALLLPDSTYRVEVGPTASNADGSAVLEETSQAHFNTVSRPIPYTTTWRLEPGRANVVFEFGTTMDKESLENHYTIEPEPFNLKAYASTTALSLQFDAVKDVDYTITMGAAMEDIYGYTVGEDMSFTIETREPPPPPPETKGSYQFAPRYPILILGTYGEPLSLPTRAWGKATINAELYRFDPAMLDPYNPNDNNNVYGSFYHFTDFLETVDYSLTYPPSDPLGLPVSVDAPWLTEDNLLYSWSQTLEGDDANSNAPFTLPDGETLPPGIYGLNLQPAPDTDAMTRPESNYWAGDRRLTVLVISTVAISLRRSPLGALIWVTDLETSAPVPNATVKGYTSEGSTILGTTNAEGALELSGPIPDYLTVEDEGRYGMWLDWSSQRAPQGESYLYMDRPIYRPGETMYFRGVVRAQSDVTYTVPDINTMTVAVRRYDPQANSYVIIEEMQIGLNQFGTLSGSWTLPPDAALDSYDLVLSPCGSSDPECNLTQGYWYSTPAPLYYKTTSFRVAEFRVPEFAVTVDIAQDELISGDTLDAIVSADYYFGSPVSTSTVTMEASENYRYWRPSFKYQGEERGFHFGNRMYWYSFYDEASFTTLRAAGATDAQGNYAFSQTVEQFGSLPQPVTVSATVTDESGQAISASDELIVHPADLYIGMRAKESFFPFDTSPTIDLLTVGIDSTARPNQVIQLEIVENRSRYVKKGDSYRWEVEEISHGSATVSTDETGKGSYLFTPPGKGEFFLRATTTDSVDRAAMTTIRLYAMPGRKDKTTRLGNPFIENNVCSYTSEHRFLALSADNEFYQPGDTAQIFIPNPFEDTVTALISVERGRVMDYEIVEIEGTSYTYNLPITDEHAPNVFVEVLLIQGVSDAHPDPLYERGSIRLTVEPSARRLNVEILPSVETAKPGDAVTIQLRVTDREGQPVQAEVGVAVTDEAALAVYNENETTLEETFYDLQPDSVVDSTSLKLLLSNPIYEQGAGCGGGGGGGGGGDALLREDFIYTPLWTTVITNEDGIGETTVTLPDNLTRWRIDARAVTLDTRVGQATTNISTTLPLIVRPIAPRFVVAGDVMPIAAVIHNNTDEAQSITASVQVEGITLEADAPLEVEIAAHGQTRVEWMGRVDDVASVDIRIDAVSTSGLSDAARPTLRTSPDDKIPAYRYVAPDTVSTSGVLTDEGNVTEQILLPTQFSEVSGELDVDIQTSLASVALESLDYLKTYPHQGIEQTVSRFLPNVVTYRTLKTLQVDDATLEQNLTAALDNALTRLQSDQNDDGGWGWFSRMKSNSLTTAYALIGLAEVREAGRPFDAEMANTAAAYLRTQLGVSQSLSTPTWQLNRQAIVLYALARWEGNPSDLVQYADALFQRRAALSVSGRAFLLMTYAILAPNVDSVGTLINDFTSTAIVTASGAYWDESTQDGWNWDSNTRTTALILAALTRVQPEHPLLPSVVRWLVTARQGDHWETTQETAWSVMALSEWMVVSEELDADYVFEVLLNNAMIMRQTIDADQPPSETSLMVSTDYNSLLPENKLVIDRGEGTGPLYYTATLRLDLPAQEVDAFANGIFVERQYLRGTNAETAFPITTPQVGEVLTVRLNVTLTDDVNYFVLEDWLPAGFEPIDSQLLTSAPSISSPRLRCMAPNDPYWCWASWYFDHTELRDTGLQLYAEFLPRGAYVFSYPVRVVLPGTFQAIPTQAYAFYQPELYGRSDGMEMTIEARSR